MIAGRYAQYLLHGERPTDEHIAEIAELLDCGELCFFHESTGTIGHYPDPNHDYFEPEQWIFGKAFK